MYAVKSFGATSSLGAKLKLTADMQQKAHAHQSSAMLKTGFALRTICTLRQFMRTDIPPSLSLPSVQSVSMATWQPAPLQPGWQMQCHPLASRVHRPLLLQKPGQPSGNKKETKASACLSVQAGFNIKKCSTLSNQYFPLSNDTWRFDYLPVFSEFLSKKVLKHSLQIITGRFKR